MSWKPQLAICVIGAFHLVFMVGELYPWERPWIMALVSRKWGLDLAQDKTTHLLAMVVHNAGIYNGIVAVGLFVALCAGPAAFHIQIALLAGGIVAGVFGGLTLTPGTFGQAVFGAIALWVVVCIR